MERAHQAKPPGQDTLTQQPETFSLPSPTLRTCVGQDGGKIFLFQLRETFHVVFGLWERKGDQQLPRLSAAHHPAPH